MRAIETRVGRRDGMTRYRAVVSVDAKRLYGPWTTDRDEAIRSRDELLALRPRRTLRAPSRQEPREPVVYFIQAGLDGPIKIGWTRGDPIVRLRALQIAHWLDLRLIAVLPAEVGADVLEQLLHQELEQYRIRGEWFHPAPEVVALATRAPP